MDEFLYQFAVEGFVAKRVRLLSLDKEVRSRARRWLFLEKQYLDAPCSTHRGFSREQLLPAWAA